MPSPQVARDDIAGQDRGAADRRRRRARDDDAGTELPTAAVPSDVGADEVARDQGSGRRAALMTTPSALPEMTFRARPPGRRSCCPGCRGQSTPAPVLPIANLAGSVGADEVALDDVAGRCPRR